MFDRLAGASKRTQDGSHSAVAMATILAPVFLL